MADDDSNTIRVVVLGAQNQGKSAMVIKFITGNFINEYDPTIEDNYRKLIVVDGEPVMLDILDTAGHEEYASMMDQWIFEGQIFVICYAVDSARNNEESSGILTPFQQCSALKERILEIQQDENIPLILVGTKCDLPNDQRTYSKADGTELAQEFKCSYVEVSAATNYNIDYLWDKVVIEYTKYATLHQHTRSFTLSLKTIPSDLIEPKSSFCSCMCITRNALSPQSSLDKVSDIISSAKYSAIQQNNGKNNNKNTNKKHTHTRVSTESEMIPTIGELGIAAIEEEDDLLNALKAVEEEGDQDEEILCEITQVVIRQKSDDKHQLHDADLDDNGSDGSNDTVDVKELSIEEEEEEAEAKRIPPKLQSISRTMTNTTQVKLFPVVTLPNDDVFEPILSAKHWNIGRRFHCKRFIICILCGVFLPLILFLQTVAFWCYVEGNKGGFYYPQRYKYDDMHHGILLDFMGIVIGRKANQDPEIERDRKWFLRQTTAQKMYRILLTAWMIIVYFICCYNVHSAIYFVELRVSLFETIGPLLFLSVLWMFLSLWIAYESKLKPTRPQLTKLRSIHLYFGDEFNETTSAYKFARAYLASMDDYKTPCFALFLMIVLGAFYGCIPGFTRLLIGDPSDGLKRKTFVTFKEWKVEIGALVVNMFLIIALMYTLSVQYKKYFYAYREWMYLLTMLLVSKTSSSSKDTSGEMDQLDDDFDDDDLFAFDDDEESFSLKIGTNQNQSAYFPKKMYLSLKRKSNVLAFLEIRSFLESQGKLFFGEQELPMIWMILITLSLTMFILYRVFFMEGNPIQSVLFNGVTVLVLICLVSLIQIMAVTHRFADLQIKQEAFIEMQKWQIRCTKNDDFDFDDDLNDDLNEIEPLIKHKNNSNIAFIQDMLNMVQKKDIHPKLYEIKLNSVLIPLVGIIILSAIIIVIKLVFAVLLF